MYKQNMITLENQIACVTGGARGIGAAIVELFLSLGAKVVISGTSEEKLKAFIETSPHKDRLGYVVCDLSEDEAVKNFYPQAEAVFGPITVFVNNAGMTKDKLAFMMKDDDFSSVLKVNLESPFKLCRAAIKSMLKNNYGRIINVSSVVGVSGNPGQANYVASKAGIIGLSKSLALEVASRGITINCVAPGFIQSDMTNKLNDKQKDAILARIPMQKMGTPQDIASCCAFLASNEASYITGQTFHVNGGMIMV